MKLSITRIGLVCILFSQGGSKSPVSALCTSEIVSDLSGDRNSAISKLLDVNRAGLVYVDAERLIVHETDLIGDLSSRASPDIRSAFRLHAVILDSHTGSVINTKDWRARAEESTIDVSSGAILVRTGEVLRFFSKDFKPVVDVTLATPAHGLATTGVEKEIISTSASGKMILRKRQQ